MRRLALVCPGRGSYTEPALGSLARWKDHPHVRAAEALRAELGLEPLHLLDGAKRFEPARHLRPANVSALIFLVGVLDAEARLPGGGDEATCVVGNSMGWYTALAVAGALAFADAARLVQEMALLQEEGEPGGQVLYPLVDEDWRAVPERAAAIERALAGAPGRLFPSIALGGHAVLAGDEAGVARALRELPPVKLGRTTYPFRLAQHGPYHTPLASGVAARARERLAGLEFRRPRVALVDGRGVRSSPWNADPEALRAYTLGAQVDTPFDFTASVRVALREHAPERLVLLGPGNTLGGVCGQILVREGWRGIRSRADFDAAQAGGRPVVESLHR